MLITPPVVFLPNSVPCGPASTSTLLKSKSCAIGAGRGRQIHAIDRRGRWGARSFSRYPGTTVRAARWWPHPDPAAPTLISKFGTVACRSDTSLHLGDFELLGRKRGDGDGHVLQTLGALLRGHHDLLSSDAPGALGDVASAALGVWVGARLRLGGSCCEQRAGGHAGEPIGFHGRLPLQMPSAVCCREPLVKQQCLPGRNAVEPSLFRALGRSLDRKAGCRRLRTAGVELSGRQPIV